MTNKIEITDDKFFNEQYLSVIPSINIFSIELVSKYRRNNPSLIYKILAIE